MKSLFEKRTRWGINTLVFGYPRKSNRTFYFFLLAIIVLAAWIS